MFQTEHGLDSCICSGCLKDSQILYRSDIQRCPTCARFSTDGSMCGRCQKSPPPVVKFWASAIYAAPLPHLLHEYKHIRHVQYGRYFSQLMLNNPPPWLLESGIDAVLAMPLSRERRIDRGFNQCDDWVKEITTYYKLPILPHDAVKRVHKVPQSTLKQAERQKNIRNSFSVEMNVKNRKVLIIDDVSTTGASIFELARTLRKSGAAAIFAWVVARNL